MRILSGTKIRRKINIWVWRKKKRKDKRGVKEESMSKKRKK